MRAFEKQPSGLIARWSSWSQFMIIRANEIGLTRGIVLGNLVLGSRWFFDSTRLPISPYNPASSRSSSNLGLERLIRDRFALCPFTLTRVVWLSSAWPAENANFRCVIFCSLFCRVGLLSLFATFVVRFAIIADLQSLSGEVQWKQFFVSLESWCHREQEDVHDDFFLA